MLSKISSLMCGIPRLITLSILNQIQKRVFKLASKQQMMLSSRLQMKELPDYSFQFSPKFNLNPFQKEKVVQYFNVRCAAQYVTCFLFTD